MHLNSTYTKILDCIGDVFHDGLHWWVLSLCVWHFYNVNSTILQWIKVCKAGGVVFFFWQMLMRSTAQLAGHPLGNGNIFRESERFTWRQSRATFVQSYNVRRDQYCRAERPIVGYVWYYCRKNDIGLPAMFPAILRHLRATCNLGNVGRAEWDPCLFKVQVDRRALQIIQLDIDI